MTLPLSALHQVYTRDDLPEPRYMHVSLSGGGTRFGPGDEKKVQLSDEGNS